MRRKTLVIMLKEPRAGRVKSRLGRDIGMTSAAWWFRHQTKRLLRRLRNPRWQIILAVAPQTALRTRAFPVDLPRIPQGEGDLGDRMGRLFRSLPPGPILLIGGDIPDIAPAHITRAFKALGNHDAVFGPAMDGGFYLVGLKRAQIPVGLFDNVRWSTEHALSDTIATLPGHRIAFLEQLRDIDTAADLSQST